MKSYNRFLGCDPRFSARIGEFQKPLNDAMGALEALLRGRKCSVSVSAEARDVSAKLDGDKIKEAEGILGPYSQESDLKWQISAKREA